MSCRLIKVLELLFDSNLFISFNFILTFTFPFWGGSLQPLPTRSGMETVSSGFLVLLRAEAQDTYSMGQPLLFNVDAFVESAIAYCKTHKIQASKWSSHRWLPFVCAHTQVSHSAVEGRLWSIGMGGIAMHRFPPDKGMTSAVFSMEHFQMNTVVSWNGHCLVIGQGVFGFDCFPSLIASIINTRLGY